jgi:choline dehydrogenase
MSPARFDCIIVGGGSAGSALANRLSADPGTSVLVIEAGRPDYRFDVFVHMPAALTFPIGSRYYDWQYESEPEPFMGGRRIYHARGKILGGSSSINGQIFQRGNPLDYERWAADPGMETWDYAHCLPYFKKMENCLAAAPDDPWRGHDGPLCSSAARHQPIVPGVLRRPPEAGYELTEDANGYRWRASPRSPEHPRRAPAERGAGLLQAGPGTQEPPRPNADVRDPSCSTAIVRWRSTSSGRVAGLSGTGRRDVLAGGAINSPQLLQSGVGRASDLRRSDPGRGGPGPARTSRTTSRCIQYKSLQPVSMQPTATRFWRRPFIGAQWLFLRSGPGATNHSRAAVRPIQRRRGLPEPDVPLPAAGHPLRRQRRRARHGYQVHAG